MIKEAEVDGGKLSRADEAMLEKVLTTLFRKANVPADIIVSHNIMAAPGVGLRLRIVPHKA